MSDDTVMASNDTTRTLDTTRTHTLETARTDAGFRVWRDTQDLAAVEQRVRVRLEALRRDGDGEAYACVWTQVDGGPWVCEGEYRLTPPTQERPWHPAD